MSKKKKKQNPIQIEPARLSSANAPFFTVRRCVWVALAALLVLWLIQFFGVLSGSLNLWEDVRELDYPYRFFTSAAIMQGEFPHWNPYSFGGMPFFATGAAVFYPFNAILAILPFSGKSLWYVIQLFIALHVLIAGVCMFAYLRFKDRSVSASFFGAAAFMFGGYMITHLIHISIIAVVAWLPLMLMLLEQGVCGRRCDRAVMGGLLLGMVMQVGHAQVMFYAIIFMLSFAAYFVFVREGDGNRRADDDTERADDNNRRATGAGRGPARVWAGLCPALIFFAVGALLCFVQYLPMFEASAHTSRIDYTIDDAYQGSLSFVQLLTALVPKFFGAFTGDNSVPLFWLSDPFLQGAHNYWETSFYFGVSTLILSFLVFRKIKKERSLIFTAAWILLSFMIALGGNFFFYGILYSLGIPGFNSFRHAPRILFIWGFFFPVMAAAALDSLEDLKSKRLKIVTLSLAGVAALLGVFFMTDGLYRPLFEPLLADYDAQYATRYHYASRQGGILLMNALFFGGALLLFFTNKINVKTAKLLIVGGLVIDMLVFAAGQHMSSGQPAAHSAFERPGADVVRQIKALNEKEIFRVNTRPYVAVPGEELRRQGAMFGGMLRNHSYTNMIETTEGYNPFRLKYETLPLDGSKLNVMLDLRNVKYYTDIRQPNQMFENPTYLPRAKLFYNAKIIGSDDNNADVDSLILDYMNSDKYDHHNEVVIAATANTADYVGFMGGQGGNGKVNITEYGLNKIEIDVETDRAAILWLSEIWYPSWKATVNGERVDVARANYSFRAVIVPPGRSKVVFKFESAHFNIGALVSLLTFVAAVVYLSVVWYRRRKGSAAVTQADSNAAVAGSAGDAGGQ